MIRSLTSKLSNALAGGELVCVESKLATGAATGFVVASSSRWLVLLVVGDDITFVGYQAFRLKDVSDLTVPAPHASFVQKVLQKRKLRRPRTVDLDLSSVAALLLSANAQYPLITIHREVADPNVCHIGKVVSTSRTAVTLHEITPDAIWEDGLSSYPLRDITRVDFGGPYEDALWLVGGSADFSFQRAALGSR